MKHYFRKAIPQMKLRDSKGEAIPFEALTVSFAFLELDDTDAQHAEWVTELDRFIKARQGGVERITEAQYAEHYVEKKTSSTVNSLPDWLGGKAGDGRESLTPGGQILQDSGAKAANLAEVKASQVQPTAPVEKQKPVEVAKPAVGKLPKAENA